MLRKNPIARAVAVTLGAVALGVTGTSALAQSSERVEITGSSIKRIAAEGALPVITINRAAIDQSGATSAQELIQALPSMQGFTSSSDSVNGGGGGVTTASLRNLGSAYTLVLLNGRRLAPFNTGSTVNLEQLPLSAIERIEVLADGASALYGSDAIAGVVNFITKSNTSDGGIDVKVSRPQQKGGRQTSVSLSKGFGNFDKDGFNVLVGASLQKDGQIRAADRDFSKTGVFPFSYKGQNYFFYQLSANANPPNILVESVDDVLAFYSPGAVRGGNCGPDPASFKLGSTCRFDYASTVEASPEAERKNLYGSAQLKLSRDFRLFGEMMLSDTALYGRFAPPAQPLAMSKTSPLYTKYVLPYAAELGFNPADIDAVTYYMRLRDAGLRSNDYLTKGQHLVAGIDGVLGGFDVTATYTHSANTLDSQYGGGYVSRLKMNELIAAGKFDPFAQGSDASRAAIAPAILNDIDRSKSAIDVLSARASGPLFDAPGGKAYIGLGADLTKQSYSSNPAPITQGPNAFQPNYADFPVGSGNGSLPFDSSRNVRGAFAEVQVPLAKRLEVTGALRYDSYSAITNAANFDADLKPIAAAKQGNPASKTTYKLAFRFQPVQELLLRGSIGTGFRAPAMSSITNPLVDSGVIGTQRGCPAVAPDPLAAGCRSIPTQYKYQSGGNPFTGEAGLKAENSNQWTFGFRVEPNNTVSAGVDLWAVRIKDGLTTVPEETAFNRFATYRSLFTVTPDTATGRPILTFNGVPFNSAVTQSKGVDFDVTLRSTMPGGVLTTNFAATYLIDSFYDLGFGDGKETSLGKVGTDGSVAFRLLTRITASLQSGNMTNTVVFKHKPGYKDQKYLEDEGTVRLATASGGFGAFTDFEGLDVPAHVTIDWQGRYAVNKAMTVTAGLLNVFNKKPPLSLKTFAGNMVGFDPRYHDGRGRTFYLSAGYKF